MPAARVEIEQRDQPAAESEARGPAGDPLPPAVVRGDSEKGAPFVTIKAADPRREYAGLYAAERIENTELWKELAAERLGGPSSSVGIYLLLPRDKHLTPPIPFTN